MSPETEGKIKLHPDYPHFGLLTKCTDALNECVCVCIHNSLCGHEEGLDYTIHVAGVAQVNQASLSRLRLPSLLQKIGAKGVGLGCPGTLIQHQLDFLFSRFWEILR